LDDAVINGWYYTTPRPRGGPAVGAATAAPPRGPRGAAEDTALAAAPRPGCGCAGPDEHPVAAGAAAGLPQRGRAGRGRGRRGVARCARGSRRRGGGGGG